MNTIYQKMKRMKESFPKNSWKIFLITFIVMTIAVCTINVQKGRWPKELEYPKGEIQSLIQEGYRISEFEIQNSPSSSESEIKYFRTLKTESNEKELTVDLYGPTQSISMIFNKWKTDNQTVTISGVPNEKGYALSEIISEMLLIFSKSIFVVMIVISLYYMIFGIMYIYERRKKKMA